MHLFPLLATKDSFRCRVRKSIERNLERVDAIYKIEKKSKSKVIKEIFLDRKCFNNTIICLNYKCKVSRR